ncbi:hypothetical protein pdam_00020672 [Pocillopora damicornis]|uniref:Peptidoglycan binding-like domain-containing protein n=1 Tax=Pocillopora damicornis TaxID=46731 RepID=A0A3M6TUG1_POCDA|nr:hypothetical protein pdam_00020672 [Pocillopora damicornis]
MLDRYVFTLSFAFLFSVAELSNKDDGFPAPFYRVLSLENPPMEGKDVVILQNLLLRSPFVRPISTSGVYDRETSEAVASYQKRNGLPSNGVLNATTASLVLKQLMYDGYRDDHTVPSGYKFKVHVPVYKDRTIETNATLYDSNNKTFDLNSPEPDPKSFGPYPVIRAVKGLKGNAAIGKNKDDTFLSDYRSGILMHTGEWDHWNPSEPMPNSHGCIHVHPTDLKNIDDILVHKLGVVIHKNPFEENPYPYVPQGILSVEQIG